MAQRYRRIRTDQYRSYQRFEAAALVPTAFSGMFSTSPSHVSLMPDQQLRGRPNLVRVDEITPGQPMFRWNRGKYDRHPAHHPAAKKHMKIAGVDLVGMAVSILLLAAVFTWVGVH